MENNKLKSFIGSVMSENLAHAKTIIHDELNKRLGSALEDKFETYASSIYEASDAKPDFLDLDKDGDTDEPMKKAAKEAEEGDEDETESEDESEEKEEGESEDEEDEESDEDSEEDEEDSEEEQD